MTIGLTLQAFFRRMKMPKKAGNRLVFVLNVVTELNWTNLRQMRIWTRVLLTMSGKYITYSTSSICVFGVDIGILGHFIFLKPKRQRLNQKECIIYLKGYILEHTSLSIPWWWFQLILFSYHLVLIFLVCKDTYQCSSPPSILSKSSPPECVSPAVALTSNVLPHIFKIVTSNVPPPRSYTKTFLTSLKS